MTCLREQLDGLGVKLRRLINDSRAVQPGDTFLAYPGEYADGRRYITEAIAQGANAVIWETQGFAWQSDWNVPNLGIADLRHQAGAIADLVYGSPSDKLWMIGVTGTNGKTSCSHWLTHSFNRLGRKSALIGTLGNGFPNALQPSQNTTPDAIKVHGLLSDFLSSGAQTVAMEVSSHALDQGRVNAVRFDVALLTNLSRDHLDYHGDMEHYAAAKRRLFHWRHLKHAVLNLDDPFGGDLVRELLNAEVEVVGYGMTAEALQLAERFGLRMVYGSAVDMTVQGLDVQVNSSWGRGALHSPLIGRFNAANLLGVLAVLLVSNVALDVACDVLGQMHSVSGRMQKLGGRGLPTVVVDYAHSPDALEKVLLALREVSEVQGGALGCVFGCGGDRDRGKRPMMGKVAERFSDWCIVTSDNPRSEAPEAIIGEILSGMDSRTKQVIIERAEAITTAVRRARVEDTVLVAGKGHEDYQEISGVRHSFSDVIVAEHALQVWEAQA